MNLKDRLIKLAEDKPELKPHLRRVLDAHKKGAGFDPNDQSDWKAMIRVFQRLASECNLFLKRVFDRRYRDDSAINFTGMEVTVNRRPKDHTVEAFYYPKFEDASDGWSSSEEAYSIDLVAFEGEMYLTALDHSQGTAPKELLSLTLSGLSDLRGISPTKLLRRA